MVLEAGWSARLVPDGLLATVTDVPFGAKSGGLVSAPWSFCKFVEALRLL
jgi:hypothetical protein